MPKLSLKARLANLRLLRRMFKALSPAQISRMVRTTVIERTNARLGRLQRKSGLYLVRGIERWFGSDRAHAVFWRLWPSVRDWSNTEKRLRLLAKENPQAIGTFVHLAMKLNRDPIVLIGLARNPHSRDTLAAFLREQRLTEDNPLTVVVRTRQQFAATFISVVELLLEDEVAAPLVAETLRLQRVVTDSFLNIIHSAGTRTVSPPDDIYMHGALESGFRKPVANRLVIVDDYKDATSVAQLFVGARNVTVLALTDLLGRADFSSYVGLAGVESIVVEHLRTRVSRFSEAYVSNHEVTRDVSQFVATALMRHPGLLGVQQHSYMAVAVADFLHFQSLKIAAVKALMADDSFDHIVIGTAKHVPSSEYFRLLSGILEIATDARVELVSIARSVATKTHFMACLATLTGRGATVSTRVTVPTDLADVLNEVTDHALRIATRLQKELEQGVGESGLENKPHIVFATSNNVAYNASTARYAAALASQYHVGILHFGARATALQTELKKIEHASESITVWPVPAALRDKRDSTKRALVDLILQVQRDLPLSAASHILKINVERIVSEVISPMLVGLHAMELWFSLMQAADSLPAMLIPAPARMPQIAALTTVARKYGVPTLTLEAHGLNANYSRYLKITSDYYGVVSEYFRKDAATGFGIPADRIAVIGTPRIVASADHDPQAAQDAARLALMDEQGIPFGQRAGTISFFCQPSAWGHVVLVWRSVLQAAQVLNLDVLLKTHPEETPTRQAAYLHIAEKLGAAAQVYVVTGPPAPVIAASNVVLTGYSAAALDAAVMQVPVICVTEGAVDYPVDQHTMIDAPLVRSSAELQAHLAKILSDPVGAREHAMRFLAHERQFVEGPDIRLRSFVADIIARPKSESIRAVNTVAESVFLDSPHPIFPV